MATNAILESQLQATVSETRFDNLGTRYGGKVRDTYVVDDRMVLVATDRISAFDHVLRQTIPFKGQVLNRLAAYFFEKTADVMPNHILSVPDPNVTVAVRCEPIPIEFVVRAYLVGHAWRTYRDGGRLLCGQPLPDGLRQNDRLPTPILTPSTKAVEGHDEDISHVEILEQNILSPTELDELEAYALALFARGSEIAADRGLILVDTKYEFGRAPDGRFVAIDEIHTPDSSRYFYADGYEDLLAQGRAQRQLSKEFVREWLMDNGFQGLPGQVLPDLPDKFRVEVSARYIELFEQVTGLTFEPDTRLDPVDRIRESLESIGIGA